MYTLIIMVFLGGGTITGATIITSDFSSKEKCEIAKHWAMKNGASRAVCVEK